MSLASGTRLGSYEVIGPLGAGGMGEVYLAKDSRLGREVAIKVLPTDVATDRDRLTRFEREAKAVSALNHPHIVTLYEVGTSDAGPFIVMERIDGRSRRELLDEGPLPIRRLLVLGTQISEDLAKANPKSRIFAKPSLVTMTLPGFRSRCTILARELASLRDHWSMSSSPCLRGSDNPFRGPREGRSDAV